jgi:hypothetical protein
MDIGRQPRECAPGGRRHLIFKPAGPGTQAMAEAWFPASWLTHTGGGAAGLTAAAPARRTTWLRQQQQGKGYPGERRVSPPSGRPITGMSRAGDGNSNNPRRWTRRQPHRPARSGARHFARRRRSSDRLAAQHRGAAEIGPRLVLGGASFVWPGSSAGEKQRQVYRPRAISASAREPHRPAAACGRGRPPGYRTNFPTNPPPERKSM